MLSFRRFVFVSLFASGCSLAIADEPPQAYTIQTVAGSDFAGDGGPALAAVLSQAEGIAVDGTGAVYVADAADNRVRKITADGIIQTVAGTGTAGFAGDGGPAQTALLSHPYGLALDTGGNLYIADLGNARVRKVSVNGTIQTVMGGGSIVPGGNGDGSPATNIHLNQPRNLAVGLDGTLYVSDFGANQIYSVSPSGILITAAGTGKAGFSGDGLSAQLAQLNAPAGLALDGFGDLYVADSGNNRVRKIFRGVISTEFIVTEPTGVAITSGGVLSVAASAYFGPTSKAITGIPYAFDIALDHSGNIYATTGQFVLEVASGGTVTTIAGSGASSYFGGDEGPATMARLNAPRGIAVDSQGNSYIADTANNRIRKVTLEGIITTIAGTGNAGGKGDGGLATLAELSRPRSLAMDSAGNLYIADTGNNEIRKITPGGIMLPVSTAINDPEGVAVDANGLVYVADTGNNRIVQVTASGGITDLAQVSKPVAVAEDAAGDIFVSEAARVLKISPGGLVSVLADGLNAPQGLVLTAGGDLLIAETGANVIRRLTAAGVLTTIAGTGAAWFSGDGGAASVAQLNSPCGLAVASDGTVWIADQGNNRIRTLTPLATAADTDATPPISVVNAATMLPGPISPAEIVTIFGSGFDAVQTQVLFDGKPATIFYASASQINALAPANLVSGSITDLSIVVKGAKLADVLVPVVAATPGIFTTGNGKGLAAANNQDGSINSPANPAVRGSVISLYATGGGSDLSVVAVTIGGYAAGVIYAGPAPGFVGLMQINVQVPAGFLPPGIDSVLLTIGSATSQAGVTVAVE